MTEIAIPQQPAAVAVPDQQVPGTDLIEWARQAEAAAVLAERICSTSMVPKDYRGKPAEATAAMLAGRELGFSPMASLRAFDNISGTPAPKAATLRAVVQAAGHEVVVEESTAQRAVVRGRRRGSDEWQVATWDIARAQSMPQYKSNPNWKSLPAQMLVARATAEVCRWIGGDAIMGMPYAAEEIDDMRPAPAPVARRLTVAELDASPADAEMIGDDQRRHMFALWRDLGYDGDSNREQRLAITAKILGLPDLESSSDLTRDDADRVITALRERKERTAAGGAS